MTRGKTGAGWLAARAAELLAEAWARVCAEAEQAGTLASGQIEPRLRRDIRAAVNSSTKSYRYVLPTQLIAKLADVCLDCQCLQMTRGGAGAFDARTVAHGVVVPFDQQNHCVLGGSPEPYVNNPLRVPEVSPRYRRAQKNKRDWDALCRVLSLVQKDPSGRKAQAVLDHVLREIRVRLNEVAVTYSAPQRISLDGLMSVLRDYLRHPSGGDRLLAATAGLFSVLGRLFHLCREVRRANISAADAATGLLADLECVGEDGTMVFAVEVKDRELTITHLTSKMAGVRQKQVTELFFIAQSGVARGDRKAVEAQVAREFAGGHNIYLTDFQTLARSALALLGERGRREFALEVGRQLEAFKSDLVHRRAWAQALGSM